MIKLNNKLKRITIALSISLLTVSACKDITGKLPVGVVDPKLYDSEESGIEMAKNVRFEFQLAFIGYIRESGLISDELRDASEIFRPQGGISDRMALDARLLSEGGSQTNRLRLGSYPRLQRIRAIASLTDGVLKKYDNDSVNALRAEMLIYEGSAITMLADLYCSGIPLSTVDFNGDWTYKPGVRTLDLHKRAIELFDSAIKISPNASVVMRAAQVLKGSALIKIGEFENALHSVSDVSSDMRFEIRIIDSNELSRTTRLPYGRAWRTLVGSGVSVVDNEGANGLDWISSRDPRLMIDSVDWSVDGGSRFLPANRTHALIASGIEARLIEAEALAATDQSRFLDVINALRTNDSYTIGSQGDTVYMAGSGGVAGLKPLGDPGTKNLRIDLVMRERAFWLLLTGRRQGDLRKLIRNYNREIEDVYPIGEYSPGKGDYDVFVDVPVPSDERYNPYYSRCLGRGE